MKNLKIKNVHLSQEAFDKDLDECLTIINYPSKSRPYYMCDNIFASPEKRRVRVYVGK